MISKLPGTIGVPTPRFSGVRNSKFGAVYSPALSPFNVCTGAFQPLVTCTSRVGGRYG